MKSRVQVAALLGSMCVVGIAAAADVPDSKLPISPRWQRSAPAARAEIRPESLPISKNWQRRPPMDYRELEREIARQRRPSPVNKIDINNCTLEQLQNLPGVGAAMGGHIMAGRPYRNFEDLARNGVPLNTIERLRPLITMGP
ncbi:MAG TPA: helix-hairpin-helix domain-containing protein [Pirellulales bacterium]|jgi:DNA uptake protein ComE-like DNA-binding protein|nr:helix-hairpin-helix domain-containing protein [Pirellulales bacterium]